MKSTLLILNVYVQSTIILDGFNGRQLLFVDLVHEFARSPSFIGDFLNFSIKEESFGILDYFLNCFQLSMLLVNLYFSRCQLQLLFYQLLECLMILTTFKFSSHILSIEQARIRTIFSSKSTFNRLLVSIELIDLMSSSMKVFSSSLSLTIICFLVWIYTLIIGIVTVRKAWSDIRYHSGWME